MMKALLILTKGEKDEKTYDCGHIVRRTGIGRM